MGAGCFINRTRGLLSQVSKQLFRKSGAGFFALSIWATVALAPASSWALDRDTGAVLTLGGYGIAGGAVLGLISLPLTQNVRSIFVGTSVGLYLGLLVGFYHVMHRDDPENPLHSEVAGQILLAEDPHLRSSATLWKVIPLEAESRWVITRF